MADFQEQLNSILSDPEAMSRIAGLAQTLSGSGQGASPEAGKPPPEAPEPEGSAEAAPRSGPSSQAPDLSALLGMLGGGGNAPNLDPRMVQMALRLYGEYTAAGDDRKAALLSALKPFLKEERRGTIEKAERAARLARVIRSAMTLLREEGGGHV